MKGWYCLRMLRLVTLCNSPIVATIASPQPRPFSESRPLPQACVPLLPALRLAHHIPQEDWECFLNFAKEHLGSERHSSRTPPPFQTAPCCCARRGRAQRTQKVSSAGSPSRRADAPVQITIECVLTVRSLPTTVNGRDERSTEMTSSVSISAPHHSA
eukprot:1202542-Pleurochrysis_carterae.AAC.1